MSFNSGLPKSKGNPPQLSPFTKTHHVPRTKEITSPVSHPITGSPLTQPPICNRLDQPATTYIIWALPTDRPGAAAVGQVRIF